MTQNFEDDMTNTSAGIKDEAGFGDIDVAVAHWGIKGWGGAEYLVTQIAEVFGQDRIYTIGQPNPDDQNPYSDVRFVDVTGELSPTPLRSLQSKMGRLFEYSLWEDVDWRNYGNPDVLITSGATTRAVITPDNTLHVNYCHSPPRWFYDLYHDRKDSLTGHFSRPVIRYLRMRDQTVDPRVDRYFVNSPIISNRLFKYYKRDATVLYPPVDTDEYSSNGDSGFYLHLGRLDEEKGVSAIVDAFERIGTQLVLAGGIGNVDDKVLNCIRNTENIDYRGFVDEDAKRDLLATCTAVVFNARNEDFGIVVIEANASGKAVLTRDEGFPGTFIEDGKTGFLHDGTSEGIRQAVEQFEGEGISSNPQSFIEKFDAKHFREKCRSKINEWYDDFRMDS